jgi:glycerol-3-phosphate acyltransferase PlsY
MNIVYFLLAALIGYICGAIPFGWLYVKLVKGIDLMEVGSGRTGGTNSFRAAGLSVGIVTSLSDVLKGAGSVWLATALLGNGVGESLLPWLQVVAGVMSVVGHNWSVFLGWRGGAGTGPNVGWGTAIYWPILPIAGLVMGGLLYFVGMASIASLSMAAVLIVVFGIRYFLGADATAAYLVGSLASAAVVTWALRPNIKRLFNGTERVVGPRAKRAQRRQSQAGA